MNKQLNQMAQTVGRIFVRTCKENPNLYRIFTRRMMPKGKYCVNTKGLRCKSIQDVFSSIAQNIQFDKMHDQYEPIAVLTNHLLKFYLEDGGVDRRLLPQLGENIFNWSCNTIFGNQFQEDMAKMNAEMGINGSTTDFERFCIAQYTMMCQKGLKISYQEFVVAYAKQLNMTYKMILRERGEENNSFNPLDESNHSEQMESENSIPFAADGIEDEDEYFDYEAEYDENAEYDEADEGEAAFHNIFN